MNMGKMLKQAQKMQEEMAQIQQDLAEKEVEGTSGGGAVTVKVSGDNKVLGVTIQPDVLEGGDVEMVQDLIVVATNQALENAAALAKEEMGKVTGGMSIPGFGA